MTASVPWSVNAVEPETWAAARDAARRSGVSVGEWLDTAIRECAAERGRVRREAARSGGDPIEHRLDDIADRLDDFARNMGGGGRKSHSDSALLASVEGLNERIDGLMRDVRSGGHHGPSEVRSAIQRLDDRIEELISRGRLSSSAVSPELERKLTHLAESIEAMSRRFEHENRDDIPGTLPSSVDELDAAVAEIMTRQALLDGTPLPRDRHPAPRARRRSAPPPPPPVDLSGLESKLQIMADEMQALRRSSVRADAVDALRQDIADLAGRLAELAPRRSLEALEGRVEQLVQRLDQTTDGKHTDRTLAEVSQALRDIREALANVHPAESFASIQRDLRELSGRLEHLGAGGVDGDTVARMQEQAAELRELLENALPTDVLRALVGQVEELARKIETGSGGTDPALFEVMSGFDRRIEGLSERIESAARQMPPAPAIEEIRARLDELQRGVGATEHAPSAELQATLQHLSEKMDAADKRLANLSSLESGLGDLVRQLQDARASLPEAAERAAKSALRELAPPVPADRTARPLPDLETKYASRAAAPAARQPSMPVDDYPPERKAPSIVPLPSMSEIGTDDGSDLPLEPGSGAPRMRLQSAALRVAQSQGALSGIEPEKPETPARTLDYIAAARRAAQTAANEPSAEPAPAREKAPRRVGMFHRGRAAFLIALTAFLVIFTAMRFFQDHLPEIFQRPSPARGVLPQSSTAEPSRQEDQSSISGPASDPDTASEAAADNSAAPRDPRFDIITTGSAKRTESATAAGAPAAEESTLPAEMGTPALRAAAIAGDPAATYEIAVRYLEGRGVRANAALAIEWLERAIHRGSAPAAYRLGSIYEKGQGVPKNQAEARRYYLIGAEGGNIKAMHNLGVLFAEGGAGEPDPRTAARWFRMAAERGVADSQYNLGVLYARGLGVQQNFAESFRWFALAASQGDKEAAARRDDVAKRVDAQTLAAIRQAVQTWSPRRVDETANEVRLKPEWGTSELQPERRRAVKK